eukprot:3112822-Rhodomonas_salina.1
MTVCADVCCRTAIEERAISMELEKVEAQNQSTSLSHGWSSRGQEVGFESGIEATRNLIQRKSQARGPELLIWFGRWDRACTCLWWRWAGGTSPPWQRVLST